MKLASAFLRLTPVGRFVSLQRHCNQSCSFCICFHNLRAPSCDCSPAKILGQNMQTAKCVRSTSATSFTAHLWLFATSHSCLAQMHRALYMPLNHLSRCLDLLFTGFSIIMQGAQHGLEVLVYSFLLFYILCSFLIPSNVTDLHRNCDAMRKQHERFFLYLSLLVTVFLLSCRRGAGFRRGAEC